MRLQTLSCAVLLLACETKTERPPDPVSLHSAAEKVAPAEEKRPSEPKTDLPLAKITLPKGFHIGVYAENVQGARSMALSPKGTLFVGTRQDGKLGKVYAIPNADGDAHGDKVITVAEGLHSPNGVVVHEGALLVGEQNRVIRFDDIESTMDKQPKFTTVFDQLPDKDHHGWKYIAVGPDQKLYIPIGAPCNVCDEDDPRFASISRVGLDGKGFEIFAHGVRNSVGFDWHPKTHELWFTDNGRDMLGDDIPSDELNRAPRAGMHFGFPYCHAGTISDPEFGKKKPCKDTTPPVQLLDAHVAALAMRFNTTGKWPERYRDQVFIAQHGSWNRSKKSGYRIMMVMLEGNTAKSYDVFAQGWLQGEEAWGRPVDLLFTPDGALLVSDDFAGAIYRIWYEA